MIVVVTFLVPRVVIKKSLNKIQFAFSLVSGSPLLFKCSCLLKASFKVMTMKKKKREREDSIWRAEKLFKHWIEVLLLSVASKVGSLEIIKIKINLREFYFNQRVSFLQASFIILSSLFLNVSCVWNLLYPLAHLTCSGIDIYFVHFFLLPTHFAIMPCQALCQPTICVDLYLGYMSRRRNK